MRVNTSDEETFELRQLIPYEYFALFKHEVSHLFFIFLGVHNIDNNFIFMGVGVTTFLW